jgi:uncharacterized protein YkuJ
MKWQCSRNHIWETTFGSIKSGSWCPYCAKKARLTIEECQQLAISMGGKCLSSQYTNINDKMLWQCGKGHEWETSMDKIKGRKSWCPRCSGNRSEELCREIIERILMEKFPNIRPKFMQKLELDGYNKELNIAFEYNGKQHYKYIPFYHNKDINNFELQKARDLKKYKLCRDNNIDLIIIPYQYDFSHPEELEDFILDELWKIS